MTNGKFDLFCKLLANVTEIKKQYPQFKLRINYTINNNNIEELSRIWEVVGDELDILQLRPIQKIGESEYRDFDLTNIHASYDAVLVPLIEECRRYELHALIACITEGNEASYALHEKLGFEKVSYFREVGRKFGKWLGIVDYELIL